MIKVGRKVGTIFLALIFGSLLIFAPLAEVEGRSIETSSGESSSEFLAEQEGKGHDISEKLKEMELRDIMDPNPPTVSPDTALEEAARKMKRLEVGCLPVLGEDEILLGLITADDFLDKLKPLTKSYVGCSQVKRTRKKSAGNVNQLMNSDRITLPPDSSVEELAKTISAYDTRHIPITVDGELVGLVTMREMLRVFQSV